MDDRDIRAMRDVENTAGVKAGRTLLGITEAARGNQPKWTAKIRMKMSPASKAALLGR
jgi:hypothetical protein